MKNVAIIKTSKKNYLNSINKLMNELNYKPKKKKILLKPNLAGSYKSNSPFVTKTEIIETLIKYFLKTGIKNQNIAIAEGTGNDNTKFSFQMAGYYKLQKKYGFKIIDLNNEKTNKINGIFIPKIMKDYEYINIAKLKTHQQTLVTLCVKNQKGLPPVMQKRRFHQYNYLKADLHHNIAELYKTIKPDLSIIDATTGIEGNGPVMGDEVKNINLLIGGHNAIDVDHIGSMIMGINPKLVKHLVLSEKISNHTVKLDKKIKKIINKNKFKFKLPTKLQKNFKFNWLYGDQTCSGCIGAIFKMKYYAKKNMFKHPIKSIKIALYAFILGIDFLTGDAKINNPKKRMIACGNCCKKIAKKHKIQIIKGCPPNEKELYNGI